MRDLRRRALESNKTVSRKTASRIASGATSRTGSATASPAHSPVPSRAASRTRGRPTSEEDDEEEYLSDGTAFSTNSIEGILNSEDADMSEDAWKAELAKRIEQINNTKRSSTEGRTESYSVYAHILMARYARMEIESHLSHLVANLMKSIRQETTDREVIAALKALTVTIVTLDSDSIYDDVANQLKRSIQSSESVEIKVKAIHALGVAAFFGGAGDGEILDIMTLFLEIVESDGASVEAQDEADVVIAALEQWGLLATELEDMEEETEAAMDAFVEQLESASAGVQIAAGENIALLYEKSYTLQEDDEKVYDTEDPDDPEYVADRERMVKRYDVYRRQGQLLHTLADLAKTSTRRVSKKDRKTLHSSFAEIKNTVEKPTRGPGYATAIDQETGRAYGSRGRMKYKFSSSIEVKIDKWWKLQRWNALRRVLQGGFKDHYFKNDMVTAALPYSIYK